MDDITSSNGSDPAPPTASLLELAMLSAGITSDVDEAIENFGKNNYMMPSNSNLPLLDNDTPPKTNKQNPSYIVHLPDTSTPDSPPECKISFVNEPPPSGYTFQLQNSNTSDTSNRGNQVKALKGMSSGTVQEQRAKQPHTNGGSDQKACSNCEIKETTLWRRVEGKHVCNPCGLYFGYHKTHRPRYMRRDAPSTRKRKKSLKPKLESKLKNITTHTSATTPARINPANDFSALSTSAIQNASTGYKPPQSHNELYKTTSYLPQNIYTAPHMIYSGSLNSHLSYYGNNAPTIDSTLPSNEFLYQMYQPNNYEARQTSEIPNFIRL